MSLKLILPHLIDGNFAVFFSGGRQGVALAPSVSPVRLTALVVQPDEPARFARAHGLYRAPRFAGNFQILSAFHNAWSTRQVLLDSRAPFFPLKKDIS